MSLPRKRSVARSMIDSSRARYEARTAALVERVVSTIDRAMITGAIRTLVCQGWSEAPRVEVEAMIAEAARMRAGVAATELDAYAVKKIALAVAAQVVAFVEHEDTRNYPLGKGERA